MDVSKPRPKYPPPVQHGWNIENGDLYRGVSISKMFSKISGIFLLCLRRMEMCGDIIPMDPAVLEETIKLNMVGMVIEPTRFEITEQIRYEKRRRAYDEEMAHRVQLPKRRKRLPGGEKPERLARLVNPIPPTPSQIRLTAFGGAALLPLACESLGTSADRRVTLVSAVNLQSVTFEVFGTLTFSFLGFHRNCVYSVTFVAMTGGGVKKYVSFEYSPYMGFWAKNATSDISRPGNKKGTCECSESKIEANIRLETRDSGVRIVAYAPFISE